MTERKVPALTCREGIEARKFETRVPTLASSIFFVRFGVVWVAFSPESRQFLAHISAEINRIRADRPENGPRMAGRPAPYWRILLYMNRIYKCA